MNSVTNLGVLVLLRHGQSEWNQSNQFTGWVDVGLTQQGITEAVNAGKLLKTVGLFPDILFTSLLKRAIITANLALNEINRLWIPIEKSWKLNERHYGALQGLNKTTTKQKYGEKQFMIWRRSYDIAPPQIAIDDKYSQTNDIRYQELEQIPRTECLKDVVSRLIPYFKTRILPQLLEGKTVLITAHGNSLRALIKHLNNINDTEIANLNIPTGIPLKYEFEAFDSITKNLIIKTSNYLDPTAAEIGINAVANQGK